jgi:hypothetical protein
MNESNTPRTDAEECEAFIGVSVFSSEDIQKAFDFARQLETELASVTKERDELKAKPHCEHCGSDRLILRAPGCPMCGAPQCCTSCCTLSRTEAERDAAIARAEKVEHSQRELLLIAIALSECAATLGWTSSEDPKWLRRAESAIKRLNDFKESLVNEKKQ